MASIRPFDPTDPTKGFIADTGQRGAGGRKLCPTKEDAERFLAQRQVRPKTPSLLYERETELLDCLDRLNRVGATFREAVDFFIRFGATKENPSLSEVVDRLIVEKKQAERSVAYLDAITTATRLFREFLKKDPLIREISKDHLRMFLYEEHRKSARGYRESLYRHLNVVFRYALKNRFITENPLALVERPPKHKKNPPKAIRPEHLERLLERCYHRGWHDRLTVFALMAFVGIRKQEVSRLHWKHLNFRKKEIMVPAPAAKAGDTFRRLSVPPNAMEWLNLVRDRRRTGPIIGPTWESLCRTAIKSAKIPYGRNVIRYAFPSYAMEAGWDEKLIRKHMGHSKNSGIVWDHYLAQVETKEVRRFWELTPMRTTLAPKWRLFRQNNQPVVPPELPSEQDIQFASEDPDDPETTENVEEEDQES